MKCSWLTYDRIFCICLAVCCATIICIFLETNNELYSEYASDQFTRFNLHEESLLKLDDKDIFVYYWSGDSMKDKVSNFIRKVNNELKKYPYLDNLQLCERKRFSEQYRPVKSLRGSYRLMRGYRQTPWPDLITKSRMLGSNTWLSDNPQHSYQLHESILDNFSTIIATNRIFTTAIYDYKQSQGQGIVTYILSSLSDKHSSHINIRLMTERFYDCYISKEWKAWGGWANISGGMTPGLCYSACSDDLSAFTTPVSLPDYALITDYTLYGFGRLCRSLGIPSPYSQQAATYMVHSNLTADILTAVDIVYIGGLVFSDGHVLTAAKESVNPLHCSAMDYRRPVDCDVIMNATFVREVFVVTQDAVGNYYHSLIEHFTRLAAYVILLRQHPSIALHVSSHGAKLIDMYKVLYGLTNPIVTGIVTAGRIYVPHGGGCHNPHLMSVQLTSELYHSYIASHLRVPPSSDSYIHPPTIIIFKRKLRALRNHDKLVQVVRRLCKGTHFQVIVFDDANLPKQDEMMLQFFRARLIIGPHGAGFANIVFAQPGATVIEVHCRNKIRPSIRLLAMKLGMRYYGMLTKRSDIQSARCSKEGVLADLGEISYVLEYLFQHVL